MGSQGSWTSVEDYLQAGSALWYGENQLVNHGQDKVALMTSEADPIGFERADSNGMPIQAELEPCLCIAFSAGLCGPSLEGCASPCDEMRNLLPDGKKSSPKDPDIPLILPFPGLGGLAWVIGKGMMQECQKKYGKSASCDKLGHCVAACFTSSWGGRLSSWCGGWFNEILFYPWQGKIDQHDLKANYVGELCAKNGDPSGCLNCCIAWWKHAWLNRTCPSCKQFYYF